MLTKVSIFLYKCFKYSRWLCEVLLRCN